MNAETVYESIVTMIRAHAIREGLTYESVIARPYEFEHSYDLFIAEAARLLVECRVEMDRKSAGSVLSAAKRIVKNASRPDLAGTWKSGDKWIYCDGHRIARISEELQSIPKITGLPAESISKIMDAEHSREEIEMPTVAEIKRHIIDGKTKGIRPDRYAMEIRPGYFVNPQYLLDMMEILPGAVFFRPLTPTAPLYCESETGDGVLLPVHPATVAR